MSKQRAKTSNTRWRLQGQEGVQAVEFALVLPILLVLVFGIIDFGILLYAKEVMANASREGARQGIRFATPVLTDTDITTITKDTLAKGNLDSSKATVNVTNAGGGFGTDLTVNLQYAHDFFVISALIPGIPDQVTLQSTTVMSNE